MMDPDTTFDQLKSLRLVCRSFNHAAAPRVLHCVRLFGLGECPMANMCQLQDIVSPDLNGNLYVTKTLVISNWTWGYDTCRLCLLFREMRNWGKSVSGIILNFTVVPLACFLMIIFELHMVRLCIYDSVSRLRTRYHFSRALVLNMPNVRRFV
jgi:hypothetical protein